MLIIKLYNNIYFFTINFNYLGAALFKNFKTIRNFYKLSKVKPHLIVLLFLTLIIPALLSVWTPILVSNTITAITVYDFNKAINQTILNFAIIIISAISYYIYHLISTKVNRIIIQNFHSYVYQNVKNNDKVKNINISILKDISTCVEFNKNIIYKSCFFIKSLIILAIIFYYNYIIAIGIIFVSIVSFFLLKFTDKKIQYKTRELSKYENESIDLFNSICENKNTEKNYNLEYALKDKYFNYVDENIKTSNSISLLYNINNNFISLILKSAVFISTIFLITQVRSTELTLSVYLILTPYLTSSAENLISFFDIFSEIALMDNILYHFDSLKYIESLPKETPIPIDSYNIYFYNVSTNSKLKLNQENLKINYKSSVCFIGDEDYKIETICKILTKKTNVSSGCIFFGDINISDLNSQTINKYIATVSSNEQFFNISIYENLYLVCPNRTKIFKEVKKLELNEFINEFENKINTLINNQFSSFQKFILGLLRAYLSGVKIINVYKMPENISKNEKLLIKKLLQKINKTCTLIGFFNSPIFDDIFDEIYEIKNNKIIMNKLSKNANNNIRN